MHDTHEAQLGHSKGRHTPDPIWEHVDFNQLINQVVFICRLGNQSDASIRALSPFEKKTEIERKIQINE